MKDERAKWENEDFVASQSQTLLKARKEQKQRGIAFFFNFDNKDSEK